MAKLLSELERFEQEMKELGSELAHTVTRLPMPPSPLPPPPPPPRPLSSASVISSPPVASSNAQPSSSGSSVFIPQPPVRPPPPKPPSLPPPAAPSISTGNVNATPWLVTPAASPTTTVSSSLAMSAALPTSASSQFTYSTAGLPFPPPPPSNTPPTSGASTSYFPVPFHLQQQNPQPQQYVQYQSQQYQPQPSQPAVVQAPQYTYSTVYQAPISTADIFSLPQQQQAQQLFQRDAQIITPEALESVKAALASGDNEHKAETKKKAIPRKAAGQTWEDATLADWPENDYRLFCGDLGNEVNDEVLTKAFSRFTNFNMARVVRDKRTGKTKGYGFVSFSTPADLALGLKEMQGKYVGNRPIKLRKSTWKERTDMDALEKQKNNKRQKTSKKNVLHR